LAGLLADGSLFKGLPSQFPSGFSSFTRITFNSPFTVAGAATAKSLRNSVFPFHSVIYPFQMIVLVFGSRSEAIFSSPVSPSREPTLGVETESKISPHLGPKIPAQSSEMGIGRNQQISCKLAQTYTWCQE